MRVLITGAFGFLGTALVRRLAADGHRIIAEGRPGSVPGEKVRAVLDEAGADVLTGNLDWKPALGADAIVHLAGGGAAGGNLADAEAAFRDNALSAAQTCLFAPPGVRLILASSIYVYGTGPRPFRETDTLAPDTLYGQLKAAAEAVWRQKGGTALRFAHIYGVGSGVDFGRDGVTERLARAAAGREPFTLHGDGSQRLDLVHIDDACEAVALALRCPELPPAVNVGGGAAMAVADLMRVFGVGLGAVQQQGRSEWRAGSVTSAPAPGREMNIALAASALGWVPRVSLADGAKGLIEMMRGTK